MYEGIRLMPWVSTPRKSARTRQWAMIFAEAEETPFPSRTDCTNFSADLLETWSFSSGGDSCDVDIFVG